MNQKALFILAAIVVFIIMQKKTTRSADPGATALQAGTED